jgi:general secretion pathway protein G
MKYQNTKNNNQRNRGFTLIEIMVVLVIMGIMAALVVPRILGRTDDAKKVAAKTDISAVMSALKLYYLDNMRYPNNAQGLDALVRKPNVAPIPSNYNANGYLEKLPTDPWGNSYQYQNPGQHGEVDVYSYGPNGQESGGGENGGGVIGSWQ